MNRETLDAYALASIGAVQGVWRYYIQPELTAKRAWTAIGVGVLAYEMVAPEGELLSEGVDRALEHDIGRYLTVGAVAVTACHLLNLLPEKLDPIHQVANKTRGIYGSR